MDMQFTTVRRAAGKPEELLGSRMVDERLPFTIRTVTSSAQLEKAVAIRHRAYARHVPSLAAMLMAPESNDVEPGCAVLLAESKLDGEPLGTLRIQSNCYRSLAIEDSVELPQEYAGASLAEATRLGVAQAPIGRMVKTMLFKAFYMYCVEAGIEWMFIGARAPLERMYAALLFSNVFPGGPMVELKHAGNLQHRIMNFEVATAQERWHSARHPMFDLFFRTRHSDIRVEVPRGEALTQRLVESHAGLAA
jgi:hypothetical protein